MGKGTETREEVLEGPEGPEGAEGESSLWLEALLGRLLRGPLGGEAGGPCGRLEERELSELCLRSRELLMTEEALVEVPAPLVIAGDIHGQYTDLLRLFSAQGLPPTTRWLFLGDYVDRGPNSIEVITLLLGLKLRHPGYIFLLRGNHETGAVNKTYGFLAECRQRFSVQLYKLFSDVFNCLSLAALAGGRILACHGGISEKLASWEQVRRLERPTEVPDKGLLCDLLWADPDPEARPGFREGARGVGRIFGDCSTTTSILRTWICSRHPSTFIAYFSPFEAFSIRYTAPKPPSPSFLVTRYMFLSMVPGGSCGRPPSTILASDRLARTPRPRSPCCAESSQLFQRRLLSLELFHRVRQLQSPLQLGASRPQVHVSFARHVSSYAAIPHARHPASQLSTLHHATHRPSACSAAASHFLFAFAGSINPPYRFHMICESGMDVKSEKERGRKVLRVEESGQLSGRCWMTSGCIPGA